MNNPFRFTLVVLSLNLLAGCAVAIPGESDQSEPSCNPGSFDVRGMMTPADVSVITPELEAEHGVTGCVETPNPGHYGNTTSHVWCCWKRPEPVSACAAFGEAPFVTTIRTPAAAPGPHSDCAALDELAPNGQRVYCCMGDKFNTWYAGL